MVNVYISQSLIPNAGRGMFANKSIGRNEVIEICPVVIIPRYQVADLKKTALNHYYFDWGLDDGIHEAAICLGFGSLYNHSYTPNATYIKVFDKDIIQFVSLKPIGKDEEITVNYNNGNPHDKRKLWIESIPPPQLI